MHDICPFVKNACHENIYSAKCEQFMCAKNPCFTVFNAKSVHHYLFISMKTKLTPA